VNECADTDEEVVQNRDKTVQFTCQTNQLTVLIPD